MKITIRHLAVRALAAAGVLLAVSGAAAQAWPTRPVTLIVAYPSGGDTDLMARIYGEKLTALLKQPVVIDNRPGASGTLGANLVAKAPTDGYTLLFAPSTFAIAPLVLKNGVPMDVNKDFTPILQVGSSSLLLVASRQANIKDVKTLVAAAGRDASISYGSSGTGSPMHIVAEMFNKSAGIKLQHIPYKGTTPALADLLGGHIAAAYVTPGSAAPYLSTGKLVPLAVTGQGRSSLMPQVPSLVELGYKDVDVTAWWGFFGPRGLRPEVAHRLNEAMQEVIQSPDVRAKLAALGAEPDLHDGAYLGRTVAADHERFGRVVREFGIHSD